MKQTPASRFILLFLFLLIMGISAYAQAPYRVARAYEDTVRIAILWNNPTGYTCGNAALHTPVGEKTRDFVINSLGLTQIPNIRILPNTSANPVRWNQIQALWPGKVPHVIVHVNAGWYEANVPEFANTLAEAVKNHIGIVSVGDDAANLATVTFGFPVNQVNNVPSPLYDAAGTYTNIGPRIDSLWIGLIRANDNKLKVFDSTGHLEYPYVNGVISNAIDSLMSGNSIVQFLPLGNGRCQADADRYGITAQYLNRLTMLGYQQGFLNGSVQPDRSNDLNVLVALQDTTADFIIRRGVSVSYEPQFLTNPVAMEQIVYDAIMFASLAHTLSVPTTLIIKTEDDTITAGEIDSLYAYLIDQKGDTIIDPTRTINIRWSILDSLAGDRFIGNNYGSIVAFTALQAYRSIRVRAVYATSGISDTATIYVKAGPAHHLVIEGLPASMIPPLFGDHPIGGGTGMGNIIIGAAQTSANGYAVLRDRYTNYVSFSTSTRWDTLPPTPYITAAPTARTNLGEGIITKLGNPGTTYVRAVNLNVPGSFSDTARVIIENITYDSLRIMRYDVTLGRLVKINSITLPVSDTATLYVQGLRTDRIGPPGSGGWVDVFGNWAISSSLHTSPNPPQSQYSWQFTPVDTGHGSISVSLTGGTPSTSIDAIFILNTPVRISIYPASGNPATLTPHRDPPLIADSVAAGTEYSKLYVKLFDARGYWLSQYETEFAKSQQIRWTVTPVDETTLSAATGNTTRLTSTRAYRAVRVKATFGTLADSVLIFIKPDIAHHLVIEAQANIRDSINDDPLATLVIRSDQSFAYDYAILRDRFGNFVDYSNATKWLSLDTSVFRADTGMTAIGEGYAERKTPQGTSKMVAIDTLKNMRDTTNVEVQNIYYSALRIYLLDNGPKYIDSIVVSADSEQKLYVEGKRSDNGAWELIPAYWTKSASLKTTSPPPSSMTDQWTVIPNADSLGTGWIRVNRDNAIPDSVFARFTEGIPGSIAIYKAAGNPLAQIPYVKDPQINPIIAGSTAPLYAKVFDRYGHWLSSYEDPLKSKDLISWSIAKTAGSGISDTLSSRITNYSSFTPKSAYMTYVITAQFKNGGLLPFTTQITFTVQPDSANHLVIEGTANITGAALNSDQPLSQIEFGSKDTLKYGYAILRDRFGNLAQPPYSTSTLWSSLNVLVVTAEEGVATYGEGKVTRIGLTGSTKIVAVNNQKPFLRDTVDVILRDFSYDSLRIVISDSTRIESLTMRSDQDTVLRVQGKLSHNNTWVTVDGNWLYSTGTVSQSLSNSSLWNFTPGDTGKGVIIVSLGNAVPDTISVTILPGLPVKLVLYGKEGPVPDAANLPYANPIDTVYSTAGTPLPLVAKIFDHKNVWLSDYELISAKSDLITWTVQEMPGYTATGSLDDTVGHRSNFHPVKAYQSIYAIATFTNNMATYRDTVQIYVGPGKPYQVVIEASPDWKSSPNRPNPVDTVQITENTTSASVYAMLRDSIGNYIRYANVKEWGVVNNDTIIRITSGNIDLGEAFIERILTAGIAKIHVTDINNFTDTAVVKLLPYHYTALRIICNNIEIDSLIMNTNQDTSLHVQGLRSDIPGMWEDVSARWENSTVLKIVPPAPGKAHSWTFSPTDTGSGWIRVTMDNDSVTKPDTIKVHFDVGPPTRADIAIITPADKLIAGEPIKMVVTIYNQDGRVPGEWCFPDGSVKYSDILDASGRPKPFVILNGKDTVFLKDPTQQCFANGIDTFETHLFYVPNTADSLHQITVNLGTIKASTTPFVLLPGPLSSIALEKNGTPIKDTLALTFLDKNIIITAIGYDKYGNRRGEETSNWAVDSILPAIKNPANVARIIYDATSVTDNTKGRLSAVSVQDPLIQGSVVVKITAPLATITSAITKDSNGNGLLDGIDIVFSKKVTIPDGFVFPGMTIRYDEDTYFVVDSVYSDNPTDSIWHVALHEDTAAKVPQTSWTPAISFSGVDALEIAPAVNIIPADGAGPVIWSVTKQVVSLEDRSKDIVTVTFSEPIVRGIDGSKLSGVDPPSKIFQVWELRTINGKDTLVAVDSVLTGDNSILSYDGVTLKFVTTNGIDITSRNYLSLISTVPYVKDANSLSGNVPVKGNQVVNVIIINTLPPSLKSAPNPASPTFARTNPGVLLISHQPLARSWVKTDNAGTDISFQITIPDKADKQVYIKCRLTIHDIAGNVVQSQEQADLLRTIPAEALKGYTSMYDIDLYWNGSNLNGMKVAPGVYRAFLTLDYYGPGASDKPDKYKDRELVGMIGISK